MVSKISIRVRVTMITILLLTVCCIGLTIVLNRSAFTMADRISEPAILTYPTLSKEEADRLSLQPQENNSILNDKHADTTYEVQKSTTVDATQVKYKYKVSSISYMVIFVLGGGILTYIVVGRALKPINELSNQMKNKSVENLSNEIPLNNKKDEIYELTLSFNKMTRKLNEAFLMQKRFSNSAAHELRTPLAVMRTKLDVFKKRKNPTKEDYDKLIDSMRNQLIRLSDIVNSLLSLTNMEELDLSQDINLKGLIQSVCNDLYSVSESKNININIYGEETKIKGNYDLMYRAFYNLVENSIKYNYENGYVDIDIERDEATKVIIKDSGIGIPDEMKKDVFEAFFTVDKSRSRKLGGAGIGLSVVKSIIDTHKGSIQITDNIDKGSIFTIML